jgi:hypothetical protein
MYCLTMGPATGTAFVLLVLEACAPAVKPGRSFAAFRHAIHARLSQKGLRLEEAPPYSLRHEKHQLERRALPVRLQAADEQLLEFVQQHMPLPFQPGKVVPLLCHG